MSAPVKKFRIGLVTANVWENEGTGNRKFHSVTLERSYKDDDEYKQTNSLMQSDLLNAAKVLKRAEEWIATL